MPFKFALVPHEQHTEEEKEIGGVSGLEVKVEGRIDKLDEVVEGEQLSSHA